MENNDAILDIETLEKIDELQNMMRNINPDSFDQILETSTNIFSKSKEMLYSYFISLKSMSKTRKNSIELYKNLGDSILERFNFLTNDDKESEQLSLFSKTNKKIEIKSNTGESESIFKKLAQAIQEDDSEQFQIILSHTNLNPNSEIIITTINNDETDQKGTNSKNKENKEKHYTLIEYAALNSSINIFKFLTLNLGKSPNLNEKLYNDAIKGENFDIIHIIEKEYPQLIKQSSLYHAITSHQNQISQYLLDNFDFIHIDVKSGIKSVKSFNIEFLLKYLSSIKSNESKEKLTPLFLEAIKTRQLEMTKFLYSQFFNFIEINQNFYSKKLKRLTSPLIFSIKMKYNEIAIYLIHQKRIKIQFDEDEYEPNALNEAIKTKNHQIIEEILKLPSIRINDLDFNYYAPIHYSIFVKDLDTFLMIIKVKNADISLRGGSNETIFHYAAYNSFIEIFEYALKNFPEKLNLKAKNIYGIFKYFLMKPQLILLLKRIKLMFYVIFMN